jgi:hypothetical protein
LLGAAVVAFGRGSVYLKSAFPAADGLLLCAGQLGGSAAYGLVFCLVRIGRTVFVRALKKLDLMELVGHICWD